MSGELWALVHRSTGKGTRKAVALVCTKCRAPILAGWDEDRCGLYVRADADPVSALGEAQATLLGLATVEFRRNGDRLALERRDQFHIKGRPAGSGVVDVLAEHRCKTDLDRAAPVLRLRPEPSASDEPNF